jgi:glycosyltransferase involved in cell wall biosynthesis
MPLFNEAEFVSSAIESLISQTYTNWILVAQDNLSFDSTPDILKKFAERESRIVFRKNTQFLSATSNWLTLYEYAHKNLNFEYVCFLAGDDYWLNPQYLQSSVNELMLKPLQVLSVPIFLVKYQHENRELKHSTCINGKDSNKRILEYVKNWNNVNLLYAIYKADYFAEKMVHPLTKLSEYNGSDWWLGLGIVIDHEVNANDKMVYVKRVSPIRVVQDETDVAISNLKEKMLFIFDHLVKERHRIKGLVTSNKTIIVLFSLQSWISQLSRALIHVAYTVYKSRKLD